MFVEFYALKPFFLGIFITGYLMRKTTRKPKAFYIREI